MCVTLNNLIIPMEATYRTLIKILNLRREQLEAYEYELEGEPEAALEVFLDLIKRMMVAVALKQERPEVTAKFLSYVNDHRGCKLLPDYFKNLEEVRFMACHESKPFSFNADNRAFCVYGKGVSLLKRKGKEGEGERAGVAGQVQNALFMLQEQGALILQKNESHDIEDILMHFDAPDDTSDPVLLSNELFPPFAPQPYALVLILPVHFPKQDQLLSFLKGSLFHVFTEQANLLSRLITRELFYKKSVLKGIYFIEEGEVESQGGRIVARGWVTNGKCKNSGFGWKFRPLPFLKGPAKNEHIWKQFINDLKLNQEYPVHVGHLLSLDDEMTFELPEKRGKRMLLPRIRGSLDYGKLTEMERVKHYDDRINDICDYKEKLLIKKGGFSLHSPLAKISESFHVKTSRRPQLKYLQSASRSRLANSLSSSSENILIMSVLKKLQALTEQSGRQEEGKQRRDKIRISPALLNEKTRVMKKKRYQ